MKRHHKRGDLECVLVYACEHAETVQVGDLWARGLQALDAERLQALAERMPCRSCQAQRGSRRIMEAR